MGSGRSAGPRPPAPWRVARAAQRLRRGGVVACPTEAVWGLSCDPADYEATLRILELKGRPVAKGLLLVAASQDQLAPLLEGLGDEHLAKVRASWPGPTTWLLPDPEGLVPWWIKGEHSAVAVRVSAHPVVAELSRAFGGPLVSTSANRAGQEPARRRLQVQGTFGGELDDILPGRCGPQDRPSRIIDLLSGRVIR